MKELCVGKTKNVYELENGNILLKFKDEIGRASCRERV